MGKIPSAIWRFLDGWKTWIWAVVMALKTAYPQWGIWGSVDAFAGYLGWSSVDPAFDPGQAVQWITFAVAVGHRFWKAVQDFRAGLPISSLLSYRKP